MKSDIKAQISITINATAAQVWEALTNPAIIKQYFFGTETNTTWEPGSPIRFTGEWKGKKYEDKGTIIAVVPEELIKYNYWSSMSGIEDKPENYVDITYQLTGEDNNITLTVIQENIPNEQMKTHSEQNWQQVLNDLKKLLELQKTNAVFI